MRDAANHRTSTEKVGSMVGFTNAATPITSIRQTVHCLSPRLSTHLSAYFQSAPLYLWLSGHVGTWGRLFMQIWFDIICILVLLSAGMLLFSYLTFWRSLLPLLCLAAPPTTPSPACCWCVAFKEPRFILLSTFTHQSSCSAQQCFEQAHTCSAILILKH